MVVSLLITVVWIALWYVARPAIKFCDNLEFTASRSDVALTAKELGYSIYEYEGDANKKIRVSTQDSPFFRMACVVTFENKIIVNKEVIADD